MGVLFDGEHVARTINLSTHGVYFETDTSLTTGELLELTFRVRKRMNKAGAVYRQFTGFVTRELPSVAMGLNSNHIATLPGIYRFFTTSPTGSRAVAKL